MTWDATTYGGHAETAIESPSTTWYFAEGATHGPFSLFYLLQNPNDADAHVTINYLRLAPQTPVVKTYTIPKKSRLTLPVDAQGPELEASDVAARLDSTVPIIAERAMYATHRDSRWSPRDTAARAFPSTALKWFLAEGATGPFFDLYVLVANPNPDALGAEGHLSVPRRASRSVKNYTAGANNRLTISVDRTKTLASQHAGLDHRRIDQQQAGRGRARDVVAEPELARGAPVGGRHHARARNGRSPKATSRLRRRNLHPDRQHGRHGRHRHRDVPSRRRPFSVSIRRSQIDGPRLAANSRTNVRPVARFPDSADGRFGTDRGKRRRADRRRTGDVSEHQRGDLVGRHQRRRDQARTAARLPTSRAALRAA